MLYALFFASGIAGLIYEVSWVRQFGNDFGNTVYSASLVTAVFMCGLGAGSFAAGVWADRRMARPGGPRSLLGAYGAAELGVAALGLLLAWALPQLGGLSASYSSYTTGAADGWHELSFRAHAMRYAIAIVLVAPPTFLMGATLTLLVRATLTTDVTRAGWEIGALYGANTAGAAVGALACDMLLVPQLGIFRAQLVAVAVNVAVGLGALALSRRRAAGEITKSRRAPDADADAGEQPAPDVPDIDAAARSRRTLRAGGVALFLSGFAALGMEIVWFRLLSATLGAYRSIFSLVLAVILTGIWLGATAGGLCQRRFGRALELFIAAQVLFALSALLLLATFHRVPTIAYWGATKTVIAVVALPALLMGFSFPLVNAHVQDAIGDVGRRTGWLYCANTIGSVAGSLAAGFLLGPWLGSQTSFVVFAACAAIAPFALVLVMPVTRPLRILSGGVAALTLPALAAFLALPGTFLNDRFFPPLSAGDHVEASREGPNETVTVIQGGNHFQLRTNGNPMSGTSGASQRYMRAFTHIPLLMTEKPERVLVICFGVGNTLHATSLHSSLSRIEIADLSRNVLEHAHYFHRTNHDVLKDPRVSVFVEDGRQHLRQQEPASYDLVTLEPPPIVTAGVSALYSREFYELVKSRLKPGGYMTQWFPSYDVPPAVGLAIVRAFVDVFPSSALLSGFGPELILIGTPGPKLELDLDRVEASLGQRAAVADDLRHVGIGSLTELVGTFVAGADALRVATNGVAPVTDDRPLMEYTYGQTPEVSSTLLTSTAGIRAFCPKCFDGDAASERVSWLPEYMVVLDRIYARARFRKFVLPVVIAPGGGVEATMAKSEYLRAIAAINNRPQ